MPPNFEVTSVIRTGAGAPEAALVQREVPPSFGAPAKPSVSGFAGERRSSGMSELLPSRQNEGYGACDDEGGGLFPKTLLLGAVADYELLNSREVPR